MNHVVPATAASPFEGAAFRLSRRPDGRSTVTLTGHWTLLGLAHRTRSLVRALRPRARDAAVHWDLTQLAGFDSVGACVLWQINGRQQLKRVDAAPQHLALLRRWAGGGVAGPRVDARPAFSALHALARAGRTGADHGFSLVSLLGQVVLDIGYLVRHPERTPWREISATIHHSGVRAMAVTAIVGFVIGVVASYLGAISLRGFGVETFIIRILGLGIIREVGPLLAAVLVAARSGSAITAGIGVMRVTQELDALAVIGTSQTLRLVVPKVVGLMVAVPLLVVWSDAITLLGGLLATSANLGIGLGHLLESLPDVVPLADLWYGLVKGAVFGIAIGWIACDYGLRIKPDTESIGRETTNSVVMTITVVILADAISAVIYQSVGLQ